MRFPHVCKKWGASAQCFPKHANFAAQTASTRPILRAAAAIHEGNDQQPHTPSPAAPRPTQSRSAPKAGSPIPRMCVKTYRSERNGSGCPGGGGGRLQAQETAGPGNCRLRKLRARKLRAQETAGPSNCRPMTATPAALAIGRSAVAKMGSRTRLPRRALAQNQRRPALSAAGDWAGGRQGDCATPKTSAVPGPVATSWQGDSVSRHKSRVMPSLKVVLAGVPYGRPYQAPFAVR